MSWFNNWNVGTKIEKGTITKVFSRAPDRFIIYELDNAGWFCFDSTADIGKQFGLIQTEWTETSNLITSSNEKSRYIGKFAGALKECLCGNIEAAKEKLTSIKTSVVDYKTTIGRVEYLFGAYTASVILAILLLLSSYMIGIERIIILKIIFSGILGGILSVSLNIKSIFINPNSGNRIIHLILGATRVMISVVSSFVVYILIKSDFLLGIIRESNTYIYYALGIISGFSETFIPNILKKVKAESN